MLVLTRKLEEVVRVTIPGCHTADGQPIELKVKVSRIAAGRVKLAFDGPRTVLVTREEMLQQEIAA